MSTIANVSHINPLIIKLRKQYREQIDFLQMKIDEQQEEINQLKDQIYGQHH
jgi:hypothetical protein